MHSEGDWLPMAVAAVATPVVVSVAIAIATRARRLRNIGDRSSPSRRPGVNASFNPYIALPAPLLHGNSAMQSGDGEERLPGRMAVAQGGGDERRS